MPRREKAEEDDIYKKIIPKTTSGKGPLVFLLRDLQLFELLGDDSPLVVNLHFLIDEEDLPVFADVERPAMRERPFFSDDAISFGGAFLWIAKDGVVEV